MTTLRAILFGLVPLLLAGCSSDGHFELLGYTTRPNYDPRIQRIYVPIFENLTFRRGIEFDLTRAVIREIEAKTPYKVTDNRDQADAELLGRVIGRRKTILNFNQLNEVREAEVFLVVDLAFMDLRPGHCGKSLLISERKQEEPGLPLPLDNKILDPKLYPRVVVQPAGTFIPELGGSLTTAEQQLIDRLAVQIISMMEVWQPVPVGGW